MKSYIGSLILIVCIAIQVPIKAQEGIKLTLFEGQIYLEKNNIFRFNPKSPIFYDVHGRYDAVGDTVILTSYYSSKEFLIDVKFSKESSKDSTVFKITPYGLYCFLRLITSNGEMIMPFVDICKTPRDLNINYFQIIKQDSLGYYAESKLVPFESKDSVFIKMDYIFLPQLYHFFISKKFLIDSKNGLLVPID